MGRNSFLIYLGYTLSSLGGILTIFSASSADADIYGLYIALAGVIIAGLGLLLVYLGNKE